MIQFTKNLGFGNRLGLVLGCLVLFSPPSIGSYLPVPCSGTQPVEEEESRSPVETVKIGVGAVHRQEDRREHPRPVAPVWHPHGLHHQPTQTRSIATAPVAHAFDLHNGLGGPLIV